MAKTKGATTRGSAELRREAHHLLRLATARERIERLKAKQAKLERKAG